MSCWTVADLVRDSGGTQVRGEATQRLRGVSTDSRTIRPGEVFVALRGERFDGHRFVGAAVQNGAVAVMVDTPQAVPADVGPATLAVVVVDDTLVGLQNLARAHRGRLAATVVAVTGSNGKTTVKELTAAVLQTRRVTFKAPGNLNNHIGLPLALLQMTPAHQVGVFELGMNHAGEIRHLSAIARPHIGVVTNVGLAHVGYLGSIEAIQQAKGELIESLDSSGIAVLNADDPRVLSLRKHVRGRLMTFGQQAEADVRATELTAHGVQGMRWRLVIGNETHEVRSPLPGVHNVANALAAAAVGIALELPVAAIVAGLQAYRGMPGRLQIRSAPGEITLIDDTYNANPQSMQVAFDFLARLPVRGRRLAVIGDMLELGTAAPALHRQVGALAAHSQVQHLLALGEFASEVVQGAHAAGLKAAQAVATPAEALRALETVLQPGDVVLLKGSRGMAMERLVEALVSPAGAL